MDPHVIVRYTYEEDEAGGGGGSIKEKYVGRIDSILD